MARVLCTRGMPPRPVVTVLWEPRDLWLGVYWNRVPNYAYREERDDDAAQPGAAARLKGCWWDVYICLLPCLPIRVGWYRHAD